MLTIDANFKRSTTVAQHNDPSTGRYLSGEPMLADQHFARRSAVVGLQAPGYSYAANNPVMLDDPTGLKVSFDENDEMVSDAIRDFRSTCRGETLYRYMDALPVNWKIESGMIGRKHGLSWGETKRIGNTITTTIDGLFHSKDLDLTGARRYLMGRQPGKTLKHEAGHALLLSIWNPSGRKLSPAKLSDHEKTHEDFAEEIRRLLTEEPDCCSGSGGCCQ